MKPEKVQQTRNEFKTHELKILKPHFEYVISGKKKAELRYDDRGFIVGDILIMKEIVRSKECSAISYTGRWVEVKVTHILKDDVYLKKGYAMLSFDIITSNTIQATSL